MQVDTLIEKIKNLPPERIAEVEDFVDFLRAKEHDRELVRDFLQASEQSFRDVWENPGDSIYDDLSMTST